MCRAVLAVAALGWALPAVAAGPATTSNVETRRVNISIAFSGQNVFLYGQAPAGTRRVVAAMEGPYAGAVRLLEKGRVAMFWLGVRQYRLGGVPGLYLVNANCPLCNRLADCTHEIQGEAWNAILAPDGLQVGREAISANGNLECLSGKLAAGELERVLSGFWELEGSRGLYAVREHAVRLNNSGAYYHTFALPAQAPDGRYHITTYFLSGGALLAQEENELFVRKSGLVAWFSRLADRRPYAYASLTVLIALAAGWVAGTLFRRSGGH